MKNYNYILKNSAFLYLRMLIVIFFTLYTSRLILNTLGANDFGIYHAVLSTVSVMAFIQGSLTVSMQRYFAYDIGNEKGRSLGKLLSASLLISLAFVVFILLLSVALVDWLIHDKLNVPIARVMDAKIAYLFCVVSLSINILSSPFSAMIIATEKMKQYALIGVLDVVLKFILVQLLVSNLIDGDKLVLYSFTNVMASFFLLLANIYVLKNNNTGLRNLDKFELKHFKALIGFAGWSSLGNFSATIAQHGGTILINIFFGPLITAARAVSVQANNAFSSLILNIQTAVNPTITKLYASNNSKDLSKVLGYNVKYNGFVFYLFASPIFINSEILLQVWLGFVPEKASFFLKLLLISSFIEALSSPFITYIQSTGRIAYYQIILSLIVMISIGVVYLFFIFDYGPEYFLYVYIAMSLSLFIFRLVYSGYCSGKSFLNFPVDQCCKMMMALFFVIILSNLSIVLMGFFDISNLISVCILLVESFVLIYIFGLDNDEKDVIVSFLEANYLRIWKE